MRKDISYVPSKNCTKFRYYFASAISCKFWRKSWFLRISLFPAISLFQPISKQEKCITNSHLSFSRIHTPHCTKNPSFHYHKHCPISYQTMILYLSAKLCKICYLNSIFMRNFVQIQWFFWIIAQFRATLVSYWYVIDVKFVQKTRNCCARENTVSWPVGNRSFDFTALYITAL